MAIRIKSHWRNTETRRSSGDIAGALASIAWRIALDKAINLHCERFVYRDDAQRLAVMAEYLVFLIQVADRLAHARAPDTAAARDTPHGPMGAAVESLAGSPVGSPVESPVEIESQRRELITALARQVGLHLQDNSQDLLGAADYVSPFIALLNRRSEEYAAFQLDAEGPSYAFLRHLGFEVQSLMGVGAENRWVIDQVMDKDGWDAYRAFAKAFRDLFE